MNATTPTRFDLAAITRDAINAAVRLNVIDAVGAWELGCEHGANQEAILSDLCDIAFSNRHSPAGIARHAAMCQFNDEYHAAK